MLPPIEPIALGLTSTRLATSKTSLAPLRIALAAASPTPGIRPTTVAPPKAPTSAQLGSALLISSQTSLAAIASPTIGVISATKVAASLKEMSEGSTASFLASADHPRPSSVCCSSVLSVILECLRFSTIDFIT